MQHLHSKTLRNDFVNTFQGDHSGDLTPRQTPGVLFSKAFPTPVPKPALLAWSEALAADLGMAKPDPQDLGILSGNSVTKSMYPYAACYAGHQFGNWAGQLGDGRAITLGEWETPGGEIRELQLKGAGPTAYSRRADGRAVLRSSLREYLMSEAMHYLGVPTTRALSLVSTGEQVLRDMFYNGNPEFEPGAIVMRVAPSFLRFGNFEMLAARNEIAQLRRLVDWTIERFYPHITGEDKVLRWFREVCDRTAALMVEWLRVGFVHGVMNTDNMSILGLTIDYGPYSFLDDYDTGFTPNTTDLPGRRYAFGNQPSIAYWNLGCLANAIAPLFSHTDSLAAELEAFQDAYWQKYYFMMGNKLGLDKVYTQDIELINQWEETLSALKPDMTIFYQLLMELSLTLPEDLDATGHFKDSFYREPDAAQAQGLSNLMVKYIARIKKNNGSPKDALKKMQMSNPRFVLRNYLLHQAIEELEKGENSLFLQLQEAIKDPYSTNFDAFFARRPDWAGKKAGCSMLSCSS